MNENSALTPQQVADILKVTKNTVYELIKRGELNGYRVGNKVRVDSIDVEAYKNKTRKGIFPLTPAPRQNKESSPSANTVLLDESPENSRFIICGQDALLDILAQRLSQHPKGTPALRSNVGSYNGLFDLYMGRVQVASCHLWDGDTGQYNVPYVRRMLPGIPAVVLRLASRMQGFYVANGNPKGINDWKDLKRDDIRLINREKGSGTRVLLDEHLRKLGIPGSWVNGYHQECMSHLAVASTVSQGNADVGLGNEKSSLLVKGIDFLPMQKEQYDLVIRKEDWEHPYYSTIVEIIRSREFQMELEGIGGYDLSETGRIIAET